MDVPRGVYFFLALAAFWSVVLTVIFCVEKRMVWPFGDLQPILPPNCDPTGYGGRWVNDASQSGWKMLGWSRDIKFIKHSIYYALMISPDQSTCAVIGTGRLGPVPLKATWLYTPTADGRTLYTTDNQTGVSIDISGNWRNQLVFASSFGALYVQHQSWLHSANAMPRKFGTGREMADLRALRDEHFNAMETRGAHLLHRPIPPVFPLHVVRRRQVRAVGILRRPLPRPLAGKVSQSGVAKQLSAVSSWLLAFVASFVIPRERCARATTASLGIMPLLLFFGPELRAKSQELPATE